MSSFFKDFRPTYYGEWFSDDELKKTRRNHFFGGVLSALTVVLIVSSYLIHVT